jgi:hypothetical protein
MEIWEAIEQLGAVRALKGSFFTYPIVNALHIMSIGALWTSVLLMDLRVLGAFSSVERAPFVRLLRRVALAAFCGALLTGPLMFAIRASEYAAMPVFLAKMGLIVLAGLNCRQRPRSSCGPPCFSPGALSASCEARAPGRTA